LCGSIFFFFGGVRAAHAENLWTIGILNLTPNPYHLAKDNMGNVPDPIGMYGRALKTSMFYYK